MRHLIAIILGTVVVSACSPSPSPIASVPSSQAPTEPPISAPSTTPASDETSVDLADVESQPIATRAPSSGCTADDWAGPNLDRTMTLADQPISFQFVTASPRDGSAGGWSDGVPGPAFRFDADDKHQKVEAMAGSVIRLEPAPTITLIDGTLELYRLDANDHAGNSLPVATTDLGGDVNALDVPLPTQAGRWLLSADAHWQTGCASGDGYVDLLLITT